MDQENFPKRENAQSLIDFKKEIADLKKQEEEDFREDGTRRTVHFEEINPDELNEDDRELYQKFISESLTVEELRDHQIKLSQLGNKSQKSFVAYIANKLFIRINKQV